MKNTFRKLNIFLLIVSMVLGLCGNINVYAAGTAAGENDDETIDQVQNWLNGFSGARSENVRYQTYIKEAHVMVSFDDGSTGCIPLKISSTSNKTTKDLKEGTTYFVLADADGIEAYKDTVIATYNNSGDNNDLKFNYSLEAAHTALREA